MKAYAYYHLATLGAYQAVADELLDTVMGSGLIDRLDALTCVVCGDEKPRLPMHSKLKIVYARQDVGKFEFPTLQRLRLAALANPEAYYLYFHGKGVTKPENQPIRDWRRYMAHFVLEQWPLCLAVLNNADTTGVDWAAFRGTEWHYSGNFWWARGAYLAKLPELDDTHGRHACEFWIGRGTGTHGCLWQSRIALWARHLYRYPRDRYTKEVPRA